MYDFYRYFFKIQNAVDKIKKHNVTSVFEIESHSRLPDEVIHVQLSLFYRQSHTKRVTLRLCSANSNLFRSNALKSRVIAHIGAVDTPPKRPRWRVFLPIANVRRNRKFFRAAFLAPCGALSCATVKKHLLNRRENRREIRSVGTPLLEHVRYLRNPSRPHRPTPPHLDNDAISHMVRY